MPERVENTDPLGGDAAVNGRNGATSPEKRAGKPDSASPSERAPRKKKTPIINRRGPSEVEKAIKKSQAKIKEARGASRQAPPPSLSRGTVIHIEQAKGFGFLIDSAGEHRFFHRSAVLEGGFDTLNEQQPVDFEPHDDQRGARALKVRPAGTAPRPAKPSKPSPASPKMPRTTSTWRSDLSPFRNGTGAPSRTKKRI